MDKKYYSFIYISGVSGEDTYSYVFQFDGTYSEISDRAREELEGFDDAICVVISGDDVLFEIGEVSDYDVDNAYDKISDVVFEGSYSKVNLLNN